MSRRGRPVPETLAARQGPRKDRAGDGGSDRSLDSSRAGYGLIEMSDPEREARSALPAGWTLELPDRERFRLPGREVETYAVGAWGPGGDAFVVMGLEEDGAYRQVVRRMRGELEETEGWAPPIPSAAERASEPPNPRSFEVESHAEAALEELKAALPSGWVVFDADGERFSAGDRQVVVYAASAVGPNGEAALALGVDQEGAFVQLARAVRGDLEAAEGWSIPLGAAR
jgi:hypothetical protein